MHLPHMYIEVSTKFRFEVLIRSGVSEFALDVIRE